VDYGERLEYFSDVDSGVRIPPVPFTALLWSIDGAGNCSAPVPRTFNFPLARIDNPVAGSWANPQRLIISGAEERDVFWTDDGSDPLGPTGRRYAGGELIGRTGEVTLRTAIRYEDGYVQEDTLVYRVSGTDSALFRTGEASDRTSLWNELRSLENGIIREQRRIDLPANLDWSIDGEPRDQSYAYAVSGPNAASVSNSASVSGGASVTNGLTLRPENMIRRIVPLHLAGEGGIYRYVFTLEGSGAPRLNEKKQFDRGALPVAAAEAKAALEYSGRSRVLVFRGDGGLVRYTWDTNTQGARRSGDQDLWQDGRAPVCVPAEGGKIRWIIDLGNEVRGPWEAVIPPLPAVPPLMPGRSGGRYVYRSVPEKGASGEWRQASSLIETGESGAYRRRLEACDGEDIEWRFISEWGETLREWRADRRIPLPPLLSAPEEGAWRRGPETVNALSAEEKGLRSIITVRIVYASGATETLRGAGPLSITSGTGEYAEVHIEALLEDQAGNRSKSVVRNFVVDPQTLYVTFENNLSADTGGASAASEIGGRTRPLHSLEEAVAIASRENRKSIRVRGSFLLRNTIETHGDLGIEGGFDDRWERGAGTGATRLVLSEGVSIVSRGRLSISGFDIERRSGGGALLQADAGASLYVRDTRITHFGTLIGAGKGASCVVTDSVVRTLAGDNSRIPAIDGSGASIRLLKSEFEIEGPHLLVLQMKGGGLEIDESRFRLAAQRTGTVLSLAGVNAVIRSSVLEAAAEDYCSGIELDGSSLTMEGGSVSVSSRDAAAVIAENTQAFFLNAEFLVTASFVARAMEIRGIFPRVTDCRFVYSGDARRAEVFAGTALVSGRLETPLPESGAISGNVFQAFTHILENRYPMANLADWNSLYARQGRPNTLGEKR
jgi:hypothetical protein